MPNLGPGHIVPTEAGSGGTKVEPGHATPLRPGHESDKVAGHLASDAEDAGHRELT